MLFRVCVWDLDGTLFYTLPTIHHYCNRSLRHFGLGEISLDACRSLCRLSIGEFYKRLLVLGGCPGGEVDRLAPLIRDFDCEIYLKDFTYLTRPYDGIPETLLEMRKRGVTSAVLTNKPHAIACSLVKRFLGESITLCIGQTPTSISKPDSRSLDRILEVLQAERRQVIYVGDTDVDMLTAKNAGVACAAALWGYQPPEVLEPYAPAFMAAAPWDLLALF